MLPIRIFSHSYIDRFDKPLTWRVDKQLRARSLESLDRGPCDAESYNNFTQDIPVASPYPTKSSTNSQGRTKAVAYHEGCALTAIHCDDMVIETPSGNLKGVTLGVLSDRGYKHNMEGHMIGKMNTRWDATVARFIEQNIVGKMFCHAVTQRAKTKDQLRRAIKYMDVVTLEIQSNRTTSFYIVQPQFVDVMLAVLHAQQESV